MARLGFMPTNHGVALVRFVNGVIAADNASLIDANYPAPTYQTMDSGGWAASASFTPSCIVTLPAGAFDARDFDTVWIGVEIAAGTGPTATIELLFRDDDAPDGSRWKRILRGARDGVTALAAVANEDSGPLGANSDFVELWTLGRQCVFPRIKAVANAALTTSISILALPGRPRLLRNVRK